MNNKFLDKVIDQIISETRIIDNKVYTPFHPSSLYLSLLPQSSSLFHLFSLFPSSFSSHCKEVYSLNNKETEYVWVKYKEGLTALMDKKEPSHQEKG
mgnify:FL=1